MIRPLCPCHSIPMTRRDQKRWRCSVKQRATQNRYYQRNKEKVKALIAANKIRVLGHYGSWMNVLCIERVSEIVDGT